MAAKNVETQKESLRVAFDPVPVRRDERARRETGHDAPRPDAAQIPGLRTRCARPRTAWRCCSADARRRGPASRRERGRDSRRAGRRPPWASRRTSCGAGRTSERRACCRVAVGAHRRRDLRRCTRPSRSQGSLRLRLDQSRAELPVGHVLVAEPRRAGRRVLLLSRSSTTAGSSTRCAVQDAQFQEAV